MKARIRPQDVTMRLNERPTPISPYRIYSIDPGLLGTGWAEWYAPQTLTRVGVITPPRAGKMEWTDRVKFVADRLLKEVVTAPGCLHPGVTIYCEMMEYQESAKRVVAWKRGDLQRTVYLIGYLAGYFKPCTFVPILVREWKGQLPKDVVERRIRATLGDAVCTRLRIHTHAWDAVGIGLHALGVWK